MLDKLCMAKNIWINLSSYKVVLKYPIKFVKCWVNDINRVIIIPRVVNLPPNLHPVLKV